MSYRTSINLILTQTLLKDYPPISCCECVYWCYRVKFKVWERGSLFSVYLWTPSLCTYRFSFQNRTDLSVPHEIKADSTGECSSQRGAPTWLEGHFATFSDVIASQITICKSIPDSSNNIHLIKLTLAHSRQLNKPHCWIHLQKE